VALSIIDSLRDRGRRENEKREEREEGVAELSKTGTSISSLICLSFYTSAASNITAITERCKASRLPYSVAGKWHLR
jgi:hypothetical protein